MNVIEITSGPIFAHEIHENLWMGSDPPIHSVYGAKPLGTNFDTLVLCAAEYQPEKNLFQIEKVIHAPMYDLLIPISVKQKSTAIKTAVKIANDLYDGKRVLVTCIAGRNRSGLVCALSLCFQLPDLSSKDIIEIIRKNRGQEALSNPFFVEFLHSIG
jgi:protein-tyrosine phosphatase